MAVALITGAASGIGRATVDVFLEQGHKVLAADLNQQAGAALESELHEAVAQGRLAFCRADVAEETDVSAAVDRAVEAFGRLDAVVNNAGVGGAFGPITSIDTDDWDYTFAVLTRGVYLGVKHGVRAMREHGEGGAIVNIASIAGVNGGAGPTAYSAAKAAVINFGKLGAVELGPERIRVNTVCPGYIRTPLATGRGPGADLSGVQPWPDAGVPRNIAEVVAFLCDPRSSFVTGTEVIVDGGLTATGPRLGEHQDGLIVRDVVGVNRGNTGEATVVRERLGTTGT